MAWTAMLQQIVVSGEGDQITAEIVFLNGLNTVVKSFPTTSYADLRLAVQTELTARNRPESPALTLLRSKIGTIF